MTEYLEAIEQGIQKAQSYALSQSQKFDCDDDGIPWRWPSEAVWEAARQFLHREFEPSLIW